MSNCLNCNAEIEVKDGRRPRQFCDNKGKCRNEFHRKNKKDKKELKSVRLIEDENGIWKTKEGRKASLKWMDEAAGKEIKAKIAENNLPENKERILAERNAEPKTFTKRVYPLITKDAIPRLEGESSLDYRIRCEELRQKKQ